MLEPYLGESAYGNHGQRVVARPAPDAGRERHLPRLDRASRRRRSTASGATSTFASSGTGRPPSISTRSCRSGLELYGAGVRLPARPRARPLGRPDRDRAPISARATRSTARSPSSRSPTPTRTSATTRRCRRPRARARITVQAGSSADRGGPSVITLGRSASSFRISSGNGYGRSRTLQASRIQRPPSHQPTKTNHRSRERAAERRAAALDPAGRRMLARTRSANGFLSSSWCRASSSVGSRRTSARAWTGRSRSGTPAGRAAHRRRSGARGSRRRRSGSGRNVPKVMNQT